MTCGAWRSPFACPRTGSPRSGRFVTGTRPSVGSLTRIDPLTPVARNMRVVRAGVHSPGGTHAVGLERGLRLAPFAVGLWARVDGEFRLADANDAFFDFLGQPPEQVVGRSIAELGGDAVRGTRDMLRAIAGNEVGREMPYVTDAGEVHQFEVVYVGVGWEGVLAFSRTPTSQRNVEPRLRVTEDRYRALVAAANEGVWLVEADGRTTFANAKVGQMLGRPLTEIASSRLIDFVDERDRATVEGALVCPRDTPAAFEARLRHQDGREILCLLSVSPMPSEGTAPATLCVIADMTALQRERERRRATEQSFRRMVETANEGVWSGDRTGRTTFVNAAGAAMVGMDPEDLVGRNFTDFVVYDEDATALHDQLKRGATAVRGEMRLKRDDGGRVDVIVSGSILRDDDDQIIGSLALVTDVTQLKHEQVALRESRERFAQVFEEAPLGMAFLAVGRLVRGHFLGANRAFHELLGYSELDLIEQDIFSVTHPDDAEVERALIEALFDNQTSEYVIDKRFIRSDGVTVWARFRAHVLRDENGTPLYGLGMAVDISPEKTALQTGDEATARAHALLDTTPDAVIEVGADGRVVELNRAGLRMFGVEHGAVAGRPLTEVLVPGRLRQRFDEALADWLAAAADGRAIDPTETTMMRVDGGEFPAAV